MISLPRRLAILISALIFEAFIVGLRGSTLLIVGSASGGLAALAAHQAIDLPGLFDRSTFYFGGIAGGALGHEFVRHIDTGRPLGQAFANPTILMALATLVTVLTASFLVRTQLISRSLRTSYFR
ncbi:MAG: hypothetical protein H0X36_08005 [Sphingomonadaceae bacterium]|nr:hypothetical protein [Sphingomonadaceae bacterium]